MSRIIVSPRAVSDLDRIWEYIAKDNVRAADAMVDKINDHCLSYAHQPELGERRASLGAEIRCFSVGMYVIYFRPAVSGIEVIRVLHGARDVDRHF